MPDAPFDNALFARQRTDSPTVELRGECPRDTVDMLDAMSMAEGISRTALVNRILGEWEKVERHRHSIVARVLRSNGSSSDGAGERL